MSHLPYELPFELPGGDEYEPIAGWSSIPGTSLAWLESYCEEGKNLLLSQFREKPILEAVLCALSDGVQEIENASWQVLTERWLDTAVGAQLDGIGRLVELARYGWDDETYRAFLRAQILVLRSEGTWPDLFGILAALELDLAEVTFAESYPAAFRIDLGQPLVGFDGGDVFALLERARSTAVRLSLVFPTTGTDGVFTLAESTALELDAGRGCGDATGADIGGELAALLATTEIA